MNRQIGGSGDDPPTLTFYVKRTATRRVLIPQAKDGQNGYLCRLTTHAQAESGDTILDDETAFEGVLVTMHLIKPNNASRLFANFWPKGLEDFRRAVGELQGSRTSENWMPLLH